MTTSAIRTAADAVRAGWDSGADDPPLTQEQADLIGALLTDPPAVLDGAA
jgi:hypothetical protein